MKNKGVPVLMYHALEDEQYPAGAKDQGEQIYIVSADNFREQMQYLHDNGFKTYLIDELVSMDSWPEKVVILTFDDGHESNYTLALPILQEFGFKAEFFITTGWIGTEHFMIPEQIVKLHKAGMGIGSHSVSHPYFDDLSDDLSSKELNESKIILQKILGGNITVFSAPGGRLKESPPKKALECNYRFLCTSTPKAFHPNHLAFKIPRFVIRHNTSFQEFNNIINLRLMFLAKIISREYFLKCIKKLLGNELYEKIRGAVI